MRQRLIKSQLPSAEQIDLTFHIVRGRAHAALCGKKLKNSPKIHGSFKAKMCKECDKMFADGPLLIGDVSFKY